MPSPKLDPALKHLISWLVGRIHVATPDEEVAQDIRERAEHAGLSPALVRAAVRFALAEHHYNRQVADAVTLGNLRPWPRRRLRS